MTTIENIKHPEPISRQSPYMLDIDGMEAKSLLNSVAENSQPYADSSSNPDLGSRRLYLLDGDQSGSDLGRIVEAHVFKTHPKWGQEPGETERQLAPVDSQSRFFVLADKTDSGLVLAGALRVVDCDKGVSNTEEYFRATHLDQEFPRELQMLNGRKGVWDVAGIAVRSEYGGGINSAWLQHALYKNSVEVGVREWISCISNVENKWLSAIGIPFKQIEGTELIPEHSQTNPEAVLYYGFYHTMLDIVGDSVDSAAALLERRNGMALRLAQSALISRFGSETRPTTPLSLAS